MQVDASMSTPGFMAEMLLQSHLGEIHLLPALPAAWPRGSVTGLVARGGYRVDMEWNHGRLIRAKITLPCQGDAPRVRVAGALVDPRHDPRFN
jgi:alpha-L-fucosidase 2